jgi:hypothetical protein
MVSEPKVIDITMEGNRSVWKPSILEPSTHIAINQKRLKRLSDKTQSMLENMNIDYTYHPPVGRPVSIGSISLPGKTFGQMRSIAVHSREQFRRIHELIAF